MLETANGKLMVYTSRGSSRGKRSKSINTAAEKIAKLLKMDMELVTFREKVNQIYVYYKQGDEEPIPIYCDKDGKNSVQDVCTALRNMMFVLSFHPRHSALRTMRKEIMQSLS
jgi:hypothetical protein